MKLCDIPRSRMQIGAAYEVIVDRWCVPKGTAYAFDDALVVQSMDDDITEIVRCHSTFKNIPITLTWLSSAPPVATFSEAPPGYAEVIKLPW